jgi:5'-3' exonuclease
MLRLRHALEWYAASRLAGEMGVLRAAGPHPPPLIFVSASDVAGEGELKLLQHLHAAQHWAAEAIQYRIGIGMPPQQAASARVPPSFLLVGPDADLLLLGLAAGVRHCDVLTTGPLLRHRKRSNLPTLPNGLP